MDGVDEIQPNFPPLEQKKLFDHVKQRLGIAKYLDFIRTINHVLEEEKKQKVQSKKPKPKTTYDSYIKNVLRKLYSDKELELRNKGKNILDALSETNLHSGLVRAQIDKYIESAYMEGSYFDTKDLDDGRASTYEGMSEADRQVLNHRYILPNALLGGRGEQDGRGPGRLNNEEAANIRNDRRIQDAEDALHDAEMRLVRRQKLQLKLQEIIDKAAKQEQVEKKGLQTLNVPVMNNSLHPHVLLARGDHAYYNVLDQQVAPQEGQQKNVKRESVVELSDIEFAALIDLYGCKQMTAEGKVVYKEELMKLAMETWESLFANPVETSRMLLSCLKLTYESINEKKEISARESITTMENCLIESIRRNSESIKQNEKPLLYLGNLLNDILCPASGEDPPKTCFMARGDDVSTQLEYEKGLYMQFECTRFHKDAFELLQVGVSGTQRERLSRFLKVLRTFFDLSVQEDSCTRARNGEVIGLAMYGNEMVYSAIRLYHVLMVRLYSAYLQAGVDAAEYAFRKHCDDVGKARLTASNPKAYLTEEAKKERGIKQMMLPPTEGTAKERMGRFLEAVKKTELKSRSTDSAQQFETDVMWAIGVQGNQFFTIPKILKDLRYAISEMDGEYIDLFEKCCEEMRNGVTDAEKKFEDQVSRYAQNWLFKFRCCYSDNFIEDNWGSVGEPGDVARIHTTIVKNGPLSRKKDDGMKKKKSGLSNAGFDIQQKKRTRKRRKLDWS